MQNVQLENGVSVKKLAPKPISNLNHGDTADSMLGNWYEDDKKISDYKTYVTNKHSMYNFDTITLDDERKTKVVVMDDFYNNPDEVRKLAFKSAYSKDQIYNYNFPTARAAVLNQEVSANLNNPFRHIIFDNPVWDDPYDKRKGTRENSQIPLTFELMRGNIYSINSDYNNIVKNDFTNGIDRYRTSLFSGSHRYSNMALGTNMILNLANRGNDNVRDHSQKYNIPFRIHHFSANIFLNKEDECKGGIAFYRHKPTGLSYLGTRELADYYTNIYLNNDEPLAVRNNLRRKIRWNTQNYFNYDNFITDKNNSSFWVRENTHKDFEMIGFIPMKYNRLVFWEHDLLTGPYMKDKWYNDDTYRLTQVVEV